MPWAEFNAFSAICLTDKIFSRSDWWAYSLVLWDEISSFIYQISKNWKMVNFQCQWTCVRREPWLLMGVWTSELFGKELGRVCYSVHGYMLQSHAFSPSILSKINIPTYDPNLFAMIFIDTVFIIKRIYHSGKSISWEGVGVCG